MRHLVTIEELRTLGRPIGHVSEGKLNAFLTEAEQLHIKPTIGDKLYNTLVECENLDDMGDKEYILLCGGNYFDKCGHERSIMGLKYVISYYVYAQNIMVGDMESTAYGTVRKNGDFSAPISSKERSDAYNNTLEVANAYMKECLDYAKEVGLIACTRSRQNYAVGGIRIRRIG